MREQYSPGEHAEAEDKLGRQKEGRKQAEFYRQLLDGLYQEIISQVSRAGEKYIDSPFEGQTIDLDTTTHKLREFKYCSAEDMKKFIKERAKRLVQELGMTNISLNFNAETLAEMTPIQFHRHIEAQKASLIKS